MPPPTLRTNSGSRHKAISEHPTLAVSTRMPCQRRTEMPRPRSRRPPCSPAPARARLRAAASCCARGSRRAGRNGSSKPRRCESTRAPALPPRTGRCACANRGCTCWGAAPRSNSTAPTRNWKTPSSCCRSWVGAARRRGSKGAMARWASPRRRSRAARRWTPAGCCAPNPSRSTNPKRSPPRAMPACASAGCRSSTRRTCAFRCAAGG